MTIKNSYNKYYHPVKLASSHWVYRHYATCLVSIIIVSLHRQDMPFPIPSQSLQIGASFPQLYCVESYVASRNLAGKRLFCRWGMYSQEACELTACQQYKSPREMDILALAMLAQIGGVPTLKSANLAFQMFLTRMGTHVVRLEVY